ncbi:CheB methylesterase domain-containing protein [Gemmobacter lanyuensis]
MAIGSSTGGVQALSRILPMFPAASPPILIVQHMPEGFTGAFARRLDAVCNMSVCEARDGEEVRFGTVYIAPGGQRHMTVRREGIVLVHLARTGDPVSYSRPSVDVLFASVAQQAGRKAIAALLTGMGRDGARGMLAIRQAGGTTFAQDEATSVVYGMPFAAVELGAAKETLPLDDIPDRMLRCITVSQARAARP